MPLYACLGPGFFLRVGRGNAKLSDQSSSSFFLFFLLHRPLFLILLHVIDLREYRLISCLECLRFEGGVASGFVAVLVSIDELRDI